MDPGWRRCRPGAEDPGRSGAGDARQPGIIQRDRALERRGGAFLFGLGLRGAGCGRPARPHPNPVVTLSDMGDPKLDQDPVPGQGQRDERARQDQPGHSDRRRGVPEGFRRALAGRHAFPGLFSQPRDERGRPPEKNAHTAAVLGGCWLVSEHRLRRADQGVVSRVSKGDRRQRCRRSSPSAIA